MNEQRLRLIMLTGFAFVFFFGNGLIPVSDPVEVNYAQTAKEMLVAGDWVSPQIYGNYWYDKPIFFYWELMAAFSLFGVTDAAARFFPAFFGALGLGMTYYFAEKLAGAKIARWSMAILASSLIYWCLAKLIITDMTLFLFMNGALVCFYLGYRDKTPCLYYGAYAFAALAVLTKGPVGLVLPGLIIFLFLAWQRDLKHFGKLKLCSGLLLFAAICSPWYLAMLSAHGQEFIDKFLGVHNYLRATVSEHPKWNVWYYYVGVYFLGTFPWCFVLPWAVKNLIAKWRERGLRDAVNFGADTRFLLVWALTVNIFFQCMATKYPTYTFPALLPIAVLTAKFLVAHLSSMKLPKILTAVGVVLALATVVLAVDRVKIDGHFAGSKIAAELATRIDRDDLLLIFGEWRGSVPYYLGHDMYSLDSRENLARRRSEALGWNSKNVMPFMAIEDVPADKNIYLIVEEHRRGEWERYPGKNDWQLLAVASPGDEVLKLYYRSAK